MNEKEIKNREYLKQNKPRVFEKINNNQPLLQLQYDYSCNMACQHCSIKKMQNKNRRQLTPNDLVGLYEQANEIGISRTVITGGEPLIFLDLDDVVGAIDPKKFYISIDTNGWFFNLRMAKHLKEIGVDRIQPSLDSLYPYEHNEFRRKSGAFERCVKSVSIAKEAGLNIFMQTVVDKERLYSQEFIDYIKYFNEEGVDVFVTFLKPVGAAQGWLDHLINEEDLKYFEILEKKYKVFNHLTSAYERNPERQCIAGRNIFSVTAYGDVLACPYFYCSFGNVFDEPLKDILQRIQRLKVFKKNTCLIAADRDFIEKYIIKEIYNKELPIWYKDIFTENDFD